jgi:hypothetical protein
MRKVWDAAELMRRNVVGPPKGIGDREQSNFEQNFRFACSTSFDERSDPSPSLLRASRGGNSHSINGNPAVLVMRSQP